MYRVTARWEHDVKRDRWELVYNDELQEMLYGKSRVVIGWLDGELLVRHTRAQIEPYVIARYGVPLPAEAYRQ